MESYAVRNLEDHVVVIITIIIIIKITLSCNNDIEILKYTYRLTRRIQRLFMKNAAHLHDPPTTIKQYETKLFI